MRTLIVLAIYIAGVVGGAALIAHGQGNARLVSTRALPAGHVLESGDLVLWVDGRQYVRRSVEANEILSPREVETLNETVRHAKAAVPVALRAGRSEALRRDFAIGDELFVCPANIRARFRALFCGGESAECVIVAEVAPDEAEKVAASSTPRLRRAGTCEDVDAD